MWFKTMCSMWKRVRWLAVGAVILAALPADAALISHYAMNGDALDAEGVQDGVLNGSPTAVTGKIGQAIKFNEGVAEDSRVQNMSVADNSAHWGPDMTLSVWVNTTDGGDYRGLVDKLQSYRGIALTVKGGKAYLWSGDGNTQGNIASTSTVNDGDWHLVTGTFDRDYASSIYTGTAKLYIDGLLEASSSANLFRPNATAMNIAGDVPVSSTYAIDGVLDDTGLWNSVLNGAEVRALYTLADNSTLNYDLGKSQDLFAVYSGGEGAFAQIDGLTWNYATELSGGLGELVESAGMYSLQLGADGSGVVATIPEPSSLAALSAGLISLLAYAWRKRR